MATVPELPPIGSPPEPEPEPAHDMDYLTNFERHFRKQGKPIHREPIVSRVELPQNDSPQSEQRAQSRIRT